MNERFSKDFRKELRQAERDMEKSKLDIYNSGWNGVPAGKPTTWSRKRKKHKGPSS